MRRLCYILLLCSNTWLAASSKPSTENKSLRIGLISPQLDLAAFLNITPGQTSFIDGFVRPPLLAMDLKWNWQCYLCESIPTEGRGLIQFDKEADFPFQTTWRLRDELYWADGTQITAKDVKFTLKTLFQMSRKKRSDSPSHIPLFKVTTFKEDPLRFQVAFKEKRFDYFQILATSLIPHRFEEEILSLYLPTKATSEKVPDIPDQAGLFYGNYYVQKIENDTIQLSRNPHDKTNVSFTNIEIKRFDGVTKLIQALKSGKIDVTDDASLTTNDIDQMDLVELQGNSQFKILHAPSTFLEQVIINLRNPVLSDVNVRKALFAAIDRNELLDLVFKNYGVVARHLIKPFENQDFDSPIQSFNLQQGKKLLEAAGWKTQANQQRSKLGQILRIEIATDNQKFRREIAAFLASSWQKLGIKTSIKVYNSNTYRPALATRRFRDVALLALQHYPSSPWHQRFASDFIPDQEIIASRLNIMSWDSKNANRILSGFQKEVDIDKQHILERQLEIELVKEYPILPLIYHPKFMIINAQITNLRIMGHLFPSSLDSNTWLKFQADHELF